MKQMDNKWILQEAERLRKKMDQFSEECQQYPDMWKQIDWNKFYEVHDGLYNAIKLLEE